MVRRTRYHRVEIQVGLFAVLGIALLVFGLLWLRDFHFTHRYHIYAARFVDTGGLVPGDVVTVSGFRKGVVQSMRLLDRGVETKLAVERDVVLHPDAHAVIGTRGLLGERYVALERGNAAGRLPPGSVMPGEVETGMAELMADSGELVRSAREASNDVRKIVAALARATSDPTLEGGMRDAVASAHELRALLETNREALNRSIGNFERVSASIASLSDSTHGNVTALTRDMRSAAGKLDRMLDSLSTTAGKADQVTTLLLRKDSTFGKLVNDPQLYENLQRVVTRTDSLISDIHRHPRRYFKFSVF